MNQMNQKIYIGLMFIAAAATSYLAIEKFMELQRKNNEHEMFVQGMLAQIQEQIQALQNNQDDQNATLEMLNELEELLEQQEQSPQGIIEINSPDQLRSMLKNNNKLAVLFFHMDGCGWCKKMSPVFEQVAQDPQFTGIQFYNVNGRSAQAPTIVKELYNEQINGYPFLLFIDANGVVGKQSGFAEQGAFENKIKSAFRSLFPNFKSIPAAASERTPSACGHAAPQPDIAKPDNVIEITTQDDLQKMLENNDKKAVIFFHMDGCGWCKKMTPVFYAAAQNKDFVDLQFYNVNGRAAQAPGIIKEKFNEQINGYPFLLFINGKSMVDKQSGFAEQQKFDAKIKETLMK